MRFIIGLDQIKVGFDTNNDTDIASWRATVTLVPW